MSSYDDKVSYKDILQSTCEALIECAINNGLISNEPELDELYESFVSAHLLDEEKNIVRLNKESKLKSFEVRTAIALAAERKDPLFFKFKKASDIKNVTRAAIIAKYRNAAAPLARQLLSDSIRHKNLAHMAKKQMPATGLSKESNPNRGK